MKKFSVKKMEDINVSIKSKSDLTTSDYSIKAIFSQVLLKTFRFISILIIMLRSGRQSGNKEVLLLSLLFDVVSMMLVKYSTPSLKVLVIRQSCYVNDSLTP